jgi:magnesium transporter
MTDLNFAQSLRASLEANVTNDELVDSISKLTANERANLLRRLPTIAQAERDEATEDFHKGALIGTPLGSLKNATVSLLYRKRVLWLVLLVFGNLFSGAGIAAFEDIIAANIVLVFFLPLLVDSGGNAGAQSATLMVRALATGDVVMNDWWRLLVREGAVALGLGLTMSVAVAGLGMLRGGPDVAFVVASSMLIIVLIGSLIGMSLPFLLSRMRLDPATASGPLITSIADAAGVLVYFGIAAYVLEL